MLKDSQKVVKKKEKNVPFGASEASFYWQGPEHCVEATPGMLKVFSAHGTFQEFTLPTHVFRWKNQRTIAGPVMVEDVQTKEKTLSHLKEVAIACHKKITPLFSEADKFLEKIGVEFKTFSPPDDLKSQNYYEYSKKSERAQSLKKVLKFMVVQQYLDTAEVDGIRRLLELIGTFTTSEQVRGSYQPEIIANTDPAFNRPFLQIRGKTSYNYDDSIINPIWYIVWNLYEMAEAFQKIDFLLQVAYNPYRYQLENPNNGRTPQQLSEDSFMTLMRFGGFLNYNMPKPTLSYSLFVEKPKDFGVINFDEKKQKPFFNFIYNFFDGRTLLWHWIASLVTNGDVKTCPKCRKIFIPDYGRSFCKREHAAAARVDRSRFRRKNMRGEKI